MLSKLEAVTAAREAGKVRRCHTVEYIGLYNVAIHSYNATAMLLLLNPQPSTALVRAVMFHDSAERILGDLPSTTRASHPELLALYERAEADILREECLMVDSILTDSERDWLDALDKLELWMWLRDQAALGNTSLKIWETRLRLWFAGRAHKIPSPVVLILEQYCDARLFR